VSVVVFENARFIAIDKPSGWLSVPSRMGAEDTRPVAGIWLQQQSGKKIWPLHRLDLEVSGLLLFALDAEAHREASQWFEGRQLKKSYDAWTQSKTNAWPQPHANMHWESLIMRGKKRAYVHHAGKQAITEAEFVQTFDVAGEVLGEWSVWPKTGRGHQIRFHLAQAGYPILGDHLYGASTALPDGKIALRSVELNFQQCSESDVKRNLPEVLKVKPLREIWNQ